MKQFTLIKVLFSISLILAFTGCTNSSSSNGSGKFTKPELTAQNISRNGCLNIEAVQSLFRPDSNGYPALEVTTDYKPDSDFTSAKTLFHTHAAFDVRDTSTSSIFILQQSTQSDCLTAQAKTASGELLTFKIMKSSPTSISLSLQKPDETQTSTYRKEGLERKFQPIRYDIEVLDNSHLRVNTTVKSFDAHCRSKNIIIASIQKDYYWNPSGSLPSQVIVAESFYNTYLTTVKSDVAPTPEVPIPTEPVPTPQPTPENPTPVPPVPGADVVPADLPAGYISVSVDDLRILKAKAAREDISRCTY